MSKAQRDKGARGEREVSGILNDYGFESRRGNVFYREEDVMTNLPIHVEVKRAERTEIPKWMKQSREQCRGKIPTVVHRRSREEWLITLPFEEFLKLIGGNKND